jgi:Uma2 family endonuclease
MPITVEEYYALPEREDVIVELHLGCLVELARPKVWNVNVQDRVASLLKQRSGAGWKILVEMPFRALPEYDLRAADIGVLAMDRWRQVGDGDILGAPEIVIEVLSPENTPTEIVQKMALCFSAGTDQFVVVDRQRGAVRVSHKPSATEYTGDDEIPFPLLNTSLRVSDIFAG